MIFTPVLLVTAANTERYAASRLGKRNRQERQKSTSPTRSGLTGATSAAGNGPGGRAASRAGKTSYVGGTFMLMKLTVLVVVSLALAFPLCLLPVPALA